MYYVSCLLKYYIVKVFTANYNLSVKLKPHLFADTRLYELPSNVKNSLPKFVQAFQIYPVYNISKKTSKNSLRLI